MEDKFIVLLVEKIDEAGIDVFKGDADVRFASDTSENILAKEVKEVDAVVIR